MRIFNRRSNNGTVVTEPNAFEQSGWVAIQGAGTNQVHQVITFPIPFATVPVVNCTFGGDTSTTTNTLGAGGANVQAAAAFARGPSTTGADIGATSIGGGVWGTANTVYVHWTAKGTL